MIEQKASPMGEAVLWALYRRLLGVELLEQRLQASHLSRGAQRRRARASAGAAALTENLQPGDTLGIARDDLVTRYLCGTPLEQLREAAKPLRGRRRAQPWPLAADAEHALLPGVGEEQASFAVGTALSARLHRSGNITVLFDSGAEAALPGTGAGMAPIWTEAVSQAVALQLPLLFITGATSATHAGPRRPPPALPAIPVDRGDALALYRVIYESAVRARAGGGPTWIECCAWTPLPPEPDTLPSPLEKMEEALRSRRIFERQRQRQLQKGLEREFIQAGWPLAGEN